ncbi:MAG: hypothetical protein KDB26_06860 [Microthrixaceae bacterium]|nr:hypothetical protein [Microthrixaceae bacterium]
MTASEAKVTLSELLEIVLAGQEVAMGRRAKAEVKLVRVNRSEAPRRLGQLEVSDYWMSDDFDQPLADIGDDFDPTRRCSWTLTH